jgi:hypothetical protein
LIRQEAVVAEYAAGHYWIALAIAHSTDAIGEFAVGHY